MFYRGFAMLLEPTILRHRLYQISPGLLQSMIRVDTRTGEYMERA